MYNDPSRGKKYQAQFLCSPFNKVHNFTCAVLVEAVLFLLIWTELFTQGVMLFSSSKLHNVQG